MANRQITIRDCGSHTLEVMQVLTEIYGGDANKALTSMMALPLSVAVTNEQLERLRALGVTLDAIDETIVMAPIGTNPEGLAVASVEKESMYLYSGCMSDWMINDKASGCAVLQDAFLLMADKIANTSDVFLPMQIAITNKAPLIILTTGIDKSVLNVLKSNDDNGLLDVVCVIVEDAQTVFSEAASKFGGKPVYTSRGMKMQQFGAEVLGEVKYARIDKEKTILDMSEPVPAHKDTLDLDELLGFTPEKTTVAVAPEFTEKDFKDAVQSAATIAMPASAGAGEIKAWSNWDEMPDGHSKAVKALRELRDHTDRHRADLKAARQRLADEKRDSQSVMEASANIAENDRKQAVEKANAEYNGNASRVEAARTRVSNVRDRTNSFIHNLPNISSVKTAANNAQKVVENNSIAVDKGIKEKLDLYKQLRNARYSTADRERNDRINKAKKEQIDRDNQSELKFRNKNKEIQEKCKADIETGFNKDTTRIYSKNIDESRFTGANFEFPSVVPDFVMLGKIGLTIPEEDTDDISVVQAMNLQTSNIGENFGSEYAVEIPYSQRLSDGISLLMRYDPANRDFAQSKIQSLVMKMFLSLPAGKVEATRIDPIGIGSNFNDLRKLGATTSTARIVDTNVWSSEKEIEEALYKLRQNLQNMRDEYGDDKESRLKKEVIRVLAITDFPYRFNENALKELHTIVRNSADLGVCVFICANDNELEGLRDRREALISEIQESMVQTRAAGDRFLLTSAGDERLYLKLDEMADYEANKDEILGYLVNTTIHTARRIENFEDMFAGDIYDSNTWGSGEMSEIAIPIGIKGADTIVKMVLGRGLGSTQHHALVTGVTGAGKSTFMHTLITSAMITYRPEDLQMYILDFKEGVEFNVYTRYRLPSLRVVAMNSEREFGLTVLKELCDELESRTREFSRAGVSGIHEYNNKTDGPKMPKLLMIFDEVQELFRSRGGDDNITGECLSCINKLVTQGRAMGIHLILATQDFNNCPGLQQYFSQMSVRIAIAGAEEGAASILSSDNNGSIALQDKPAGSAIYNTDAGSPKGNNFFQIAYLREDVRDKILTCLDTYYRDDVIAPMYDNNQTRVLLTNAEENVNNCFNRLILDGPSSLRPLGDGADGYGLFLGQGFGKKSDLVPVIRRTKGDNVIVVTRDEKVAMSLFELSALSILHDELNTDADKANALIYLVDLSAISVDFDECDFSWMCDQFPQQITRAMKRDIKQLIDDLYEIVMGRADGSLPCDERIFFMLFGLNRARNITQTGIYDASSIDDISHADKLKKILEAGPALGVNSIIWSETVMGAETVLGTKFDGLFDNRIAYDLSAQDLDRLVDETNPGSLRGRTAVYMNYAEDSRNTHFRPYNVPSRKWIERYAEVYEELANSDYAEY